MGKPPAGQGGVSPPGAAVGSGCQLQALKLMPDGLALFG
jgi:hypothetical protein